MPPCFSLPGGEERGRGSLRRGKDKTPQHSGQAVWGADGDQGVVQGYVRTSPVDHRPLESRSTVLLLAGGRSICQWTPGESMSLALEMASPKARRALVTRQGDLR